MLFRIILALLGDKEEQKRLKEDFTIKENFGYRAFCYIAAVIGISLLITMFCAIFNMFN